MAITPENRKLFERLEVDVVRTDLLREFEGNNLIPRGRARLEALEWLTEQEGVRRRQETRRYWFMLGLTALTLIVASVAAWPAFKEWLP